MICQINGITHKGEGVAKINGKAVFVPFALPGETVEIELTVDKKKYGMARLLKVIEPSPQRVEPWCPHFYACGGCSYQHTSYENQLALKTQTVNDALVRIGKVNSQVEKCLGMIEPWRYRNKVTWQINKNQSGQPVLGYYKSGSNQIIPIHTCKIISRGMEDATGTLRELLPMLEIGDKAQAVIRQSSLDGRKMLVLSGLKSLPEAQIIRKLASAFDSINSVIGNQTYCHYGEAYLTERINEIEFRISPQAFFQVNPLQNQKIIGTVEEFLEPQGFTRVLDLYCGSGNIALNLANKVREVVGIEEYPPAVIDAQNNALLNGITNCRFFSGPCEKILGNLKEPFDAVILDPPRSGASKEVIKEIVKTNPEKIIYVSCNPATLARDLALFQQEQFQVAKVQPIDMFPQTSHVECVVLMSRL
jgi:23S rRNA (uracil1939-C5)-methyltransferase